MPTAEQTPTVLVVDDNAQSRALVQAALEDEGIPVLLASNGEQGIALFIEHQPDCVLLDVNMPGMGGPAVCAHIRRLPEGVDTPIVFLTAQRDVDTFDQALGAGGDDFLTKPIHPTALAVRVRGALKLSRVKNELREHYAIVRQQRDELIRLQLQKERLTAFVVHDLKNPVNAIDLCAQLLSRNRELSESARGTVQQIREEVRALMRLILNLLDISKGEEGKLVPRLTDVDLQQLAQQVLDAMQARAQSERVTLAAHVNTERCSADPDLLRRVLENLVDNAIRHAPEDSEVTLSILDAEGGVEIQVADRGPGVPPDLAKKVFERYVQAEVELGQRTGRGLGLAFCKLAVEAHGGNIRLESREPGALFRIWLPR